MAAKKKNTKKPVTKADNSNSGLVTGEITLIGFFLISLLLFLSNFGGETSLIGKFGDALRSFQLGFFGVLGYVFPVALFVMAAFVLGNYKNPRIWLKVLAVIFTVISLCTLIQIIFRGESGGSLGMFFTDVLSGLVGTVGTFLIMLAILIVSIVFITEKSVVRLVKKGGSKAYSAAREDISIRRLEHTAKVYEKRQIRKADALRRVEGIDFEATDLSRLKTVADKKTENLPDYDIKTTDEFRTPEDSIKTADPDAFVGKINFPQVYDNDSVPFENEDEGTKAAFAKAREILAADDYRQDDEEELTQSEQIINAIPEERNIVTATGKVIKSDRENTIARMEEAKKSTELGQLREDVKKKSSIVRSKPYKIPPLNLLTRGTSGNGAGSDSEYKQTAIKLQQTLNTFGISVTVTDISCGPTVTRYEMHPEQGVKVARIMALQDDLKLALAAADIRIEAPIPGKAAIGIEVPNKESHIVQLRDILETKTFKESKAKIAFAIGKDIGGSTIVADLAKMPHVLIAGATGSGKSVCINTLILSILYKYSPEDVKMIMIDPKMVELSCYNGIPHLLIPVVTDVKKATGALNWAVAEMEDRYKKFESVGAKDITSYNENIEAARASLIDEGMDDSELPEKLPTIVIIVDELADMMMQCKGEVEPAIVRISQLARAAGMHLVIATQRPSVNVITGLIKANIPSRIALSVTSGVDSRTIIDTVGAEKLLGHGDMLYNPQDAPKPMRAQGAFVSEHDIHNVVSYILNEKIIPSYDENTFSQMVLPIAEAAGSSGDERDDLFVQAGRYIIDKKKASIGNLQRAFRIGFNRAARIMDQLCDAGVVGPEQGTKPREILMDETQFEELCK
ncbi:MAG: DNA translocase FtsK [Lachnospiraceae bacterium]|nr:DNA translocase FtsK [Lachnospiraceae bacterium]